MKGAKNLICPKCGGFFAHFSEYNRFGRVTKIIKCDCGLEHKTITDGDITTTVIKLGESVLHKDKQHVH